LSLQVAAEGREIPVTLIKPENMLAVSHPPVMRLVLLNQSKLSQLFQRYQIDDHINEASLIQFAKDFNVVPGWCTAEQLHAVFVMVNESEA
jgi:hypothetical protein